MNASGRRLDVWLVYRCTVCDAAHNLRVHERVRPESLGTDLERYHRNDPALARAIGCDPRLLGGAERDVPVVVDGPRRLPLRVRLEVAVAVPVRLDRLVATTLAIPRGQVGGVVTTSAALRRPVRDGTELVIHGCRPRR